MSQQEQDFVDAVNAVHPIMRRWGWYRGYTPWEAEDAVQTAATETWKNRAQFPEAKEDDFRALLVYLSKFRLIDGHRSEPPPTAGDALNDRGPWEPQDGGCDVEAAVEARLRLAALLAQRGGDAALLNALGFSYDEIAAVDGRAPETLKVAACHARTAVKKSEWPYRHALLDPRPGAANPVLDGRAVLGVEVTVPALAARCTLGNLDGQHGRAAAQRAAIELALEAPLPPQGAVLVTIRPDLDSLGAMAVLGLRASGRVTAAACERVAEIAAADGGPSSPWPGPRPLLAPNGASAPGGASLRGIGAIVAGAGLELGERVWRVAAWLLTGSCDGLRAAAAKAERDWERAVAGAHVVAASGARVAVVCSAERLAVEVGYCVAPVVAAENPCFRLAGGPPHRKVTIAQYGPGWVDLGGVVGDLGAREPGWGGTATICGSPQGTSTAIPLEEIVATLERHLLAGGACR